ncbi:Trimeric LpxA-like protein [Pleurostoma richardsiae]|uniref:Dynactin subunit 6 n=1 Tax=Pleurostoma richardsiae TaxID=41990 RepID=A0AA38RK84_9PEZI|nr:Trimeric LpxA-like protein [Pleurostoma richardsiae]
MSSSSSSKRHSILPPISQAGPKAPVSFSSSILVADSAILTGSHPISVSSESVIHPRARLDSLGGPVAIGRRCIIHERTSIGAAPPGPPPVGGGGEAGVTLGDYVTVEVGAVVETGGTVLGEGSVVGVGCRVGKGAVIGKYCTLTPQTKIAAGEKVPDYTVVYSNNLRRLDKRGVPELRIKGQARQIEVLRRLIPSNPSKFQ